MKSSMHAMLDFLSVYVIHVHNKDIVVGDIFYLLLTLAFGLGSCASFISAVVFVTFDTI